MKKLLLVFMFVFMIGLATAETTLLSPPNGNVNESATVSFRASASSPISPLLNMSLHTNSSGTWSFIEGVSFGTDTSNTENQTSDNSLDPTLNAANWRGQTFTIGDNGDAGPYGVNGVQLHITTQGDGTGIEIYFAALDANGFPAQHLAQNLTWDDGDGVGIINISFNQSVNVVDGGKYAIYMKTGGGSDMAMRTSSTDIYNGGTFITNTGSWANSSNDAYFKLISGNSLSATQTFSDTISGLTTWNVLTCFQNNTCAFAPSNFTVDLDVTSPALTLSSPIINEGYHKINTNLYLNWTVSDTLAVDTCRYQYNGVNTTVTCGDGNVTFSTPSYSLRDILFFVNDTAGNRNTSTITWDYSIFETNNTYNRTTYETATETYYLNVTLNSSFTLDTAKLNWNGTLYSGTIADSGDDKRITYSQAIRGGVKNVSVFWNLTLTDASSFLTVNDTQNISLTNISLCNQPHTVPYINFSYQNETTAKEKVTGFVATSTWFFWLGNDANMNKSITYSTSNLNGSHSFCATPPHKNFNVDVIYEYDNLYSEQRVYNNVSLQISNTTTNQVLWLLPTSETSFITFTVLSAAGQPIDGATLTLSRDGFGVVYSRTTGSSGSLTIPLDPDITYTLEVIKTGFPTFTTTEVFGTSPVVITLGSASSDSNITDFSRQLTTSISPVNTTLFNQTDYTFSLNITSNYNTVTEFGFYLKNATGDTLGKTSATTSGGFLSIVNNTGANNTLMKMEYYYIINATYINGTKTWTVIDTSDTRWSLKVFGDDLRTFLTQGRFGLTGVGLNIIIFILIFTLTGVISYSFGVTSPSSVLWTMAFITLIFDQLSLITYPAILNNNYLIGGPASFAMVILAIASMLVIRKT